MIWDAVSSQSCFCWFYRASPSLAAKNIVSLISVLTIWWCPCVESSLVMLDDGPCYDQCIFSANSVSLCPASFCIPQPNFAVTPGFLMSYFCVPVPRMKRSSFFFFFLVLVLEGLVGLHRTVQLQLLHQLWEIMHLKTASIPPILYSMTHLNTETI